MTDADLILPDESYAIMGACFEVYKEMGPGFLESVYHECLQREFQNRDIPFVSEQKIELTYKGKRLDQFYQADFICFDSVIVEIKAVRELQPIHRAQVLNYLKATGHRLGILINFTSEPRLKYERIVH